VLPANTLLAMLPANRPSQNRRRCWISGSARCTRSRAEPASLASSPSRSGSTASSWARTRRASVGDCPEVAIATTSGERSTMAGITADEAAPSSTTLTKMARAAPAAATAWLTSLLSVAAIANITPSKCRGSNSRPRCSMRPASRYSARSECSRGATTRTRAWAFSSSSTFRLATAPPPTTRASLSRRLRNTGR